jgi:hypothetical protein
MFRHPCFGRGKRFPTEETEKEFAKDKVKYKIKTKKKICNLFIINIIAHSVLFLLY